MSQVVWSARALDDLKKIHAYIAEDSPVQASKVAGEITAYTRTLEWKARLNIKLFSKQIIHIIRRERSE